MVSVDSNGQVHLLNVSDGREQKAVRLTLGEYRLFDPIRDDPSDEKLLEPGRATADLKVIGLANRNRAFFFDLTSGTPIRDLNDVAHAAEKVCGFPLAFDHSGRTMVMLMQQVAGQNAVTIVEVPSGKIQHQFPLRSEWENNWVFSLDGMRLASTRSNEVLLRHRDGNVERLIALPK